VAFIAVGPTVVRHGCGPWNRDWEELVKRKLEYCWSLDVDAGAGRNYKVFTVG
jgi:hypothetical protein